MPGAGTAMATAVAAANTVTVAMAVPVRMVSPATSGDEQVVSSNSSPIAVNNCATVHRSTSCTTAPELVEENERLKKENMQLSNELSQLKGLCNNILAMMSSYASGFSRQLESSTSAATARGVVVTEGKVLDLLPTRNVSVAEENAAVNVDGAAGGMPCETASLVEPEVQAAPQVPKLFGVSIGIKRCRTENEVELEREEREQHQQMRMQMQTQSSQEPDRGSDVKSEPRDGDSDDQERRWSSMK